MNQIKPQELRIGNYLETSYEGIVEVRGILNTDAHPLIDFRKVGHKFNTVGRYEIEAFKPIPITEERLLRLGFEYDQVTWFLNVAIEWNNNVLKLYKGKGQTIFLPCEHIHTLQNLIYYFTGEELTFKS